MTEHDEHGSPTERPYAPTPIPPPPADNAPANLETVLQELRHQRGMIGAISKTQKDLTNRLNLYIPGFDDLGGRVHRIERSLQAASHAFDQPVRESLILPTRPNGTTDAE